MTQPIKLSPEVLAGIAATQAQQAEDDKAGLVAATTTLPGPLKDVWEVSPSIQEGPYTVRKFTIGDFKRLAALGHRLNSFSAFSAWLDEPEPFDDDAKILDWIMTRSVEEVAATIPQGRDKILELAELEFGELSGGQLIMLMRTIVIQLAKCLEVKLQYKPAETANGEATSPPS